MMWSAELGKAKRELQQWVNRRLAQLFLWTLTAKASSIGDNDAVESSDEGQDPGAPPNEPKGQRKVTRVLPWGLQGMPPKGVRGLTLRLGMSNLFFIGIGPTQTYGPQSLNEGETSLYNIIAGCQQVFDQNGNVNINSGTPRGGSQGSVVVNDGTLPVARKTDTVDMGTWQVTVNPTSGAITAISWTPPGGGTSIVFNAVTPGPFSLTGKISSGASNFKG
jgi:hypothetical protein